MGDGLSLSDVAPLCYNFDSISVAWAAVARGQLPLNYSRISNLEVT
jgi:hypothetical protein